MQNRYEIEHAPANLALRGKEQENLKVHAQMQYRMLALMQYGSVIGARSR